TQSGDILNWQNVLDSNLVCDKHSTGGVGDKVSLVLAPILAACGLYVPMISGRGLGHTGGTLDKFDSIPGYNTHPSIDTFQKVVKDVGCAIIGQTSNLAPADKKLYSIRDTVGTVESLPLITSSILSKKIASGLRSLVLDVKVGNGSFNATLDVSKNLAMSLVNVAKGAGLQCEAILTDMNQILGRSAGHALEVTECVEYLTMKNRHPRLETITNKLVTSILIMTKKISKIRATEEINKVLSSGLAAEKFEKMVSALGGSNSFLNNYTTKMTKAPYIENISLGKQGYIKEIKTRELGLILIELGGGRKQANDNINYQVGFDNVKGLGDFVDAPTSIIQVHSQSKDDFERVKDQIIKCFTLSDGKVSPSETIYETIN
ncbi:thymidine phosphorylase, partial [Alphaproteobacteria bacterium]|nr:thymidine phosphorylase [Alphaproteobacteria bacterium]